MLAKPWTLRFAVVFTTWLACCVTALPVPPVSDKAQITILYDAFGKSSDMQEDWGYAALVEYGGKRILFDTGGIRTFLRETRRPKGLISQS